MDHPGTSILLKRRRKIGQLLRGESHAEAETRSTRPQAQECQDSPQKLGEARNPFSPRASRDRVALATLTGEFQLPELFMVIWDGSLRKLAPSL